ncbi:hypothetical protein [Selenomonas sp. AE3005]|uniref:hypothetical protein n=1 Tax=Selenomonas sp. AE3005 TaxID=1485543 RepID=UPI0012DD37A2|nr:hypothetical protein [Selenomonas sp. AE3005]
MAKLEQRRYKKAHGREQISPNHELIIILQIRSVWQYPIPYPWKSPKHLRWPQETYASLA